MDQDQLWRASLFKATCWVVIFLLKIRLCVETLFIKSEPELRSLRHQCHFLRCSYISCALLLKNIR